MRNTNVWPTEILHMHTYIGTYKNSISQDMVCTQPIMERAYVHEKKDGNLIGIIQAHTAVEEV